MNNLLNTGDTIVCANPAESKDSQLTALNVIWRHGWSFAETRDTLADSLFSAIPNEILVRIFKFLSVRDLCNVSLVCRSFKMIADEDEIWKLKFNSKHFFLVFILSKYEYSK